MWDLFLQVLFIGVIVCWVVLLSHIFVLDFDWFRDMKKIDIKKWIEKRKHKKALDELRELRGFIGYLHITLNIRNDKDYVVKMGFYATCYEILGRITEGYEKYPLFYLPLIKKHEDTFRFLKSILEPPYKDGKFSFFMDDNVIQRLKKIIDVVHEDVEEIEKVRKGQKDVEKESLLHRMDQYYEGIRNRDFHTVNSQEQQEPVTADELINHTIAELEKINQKR